MTQYISRAPSGCHQTHRPVGLAAMVLLCCAQTLACTDAMVGAECLAGTVCGPLELVSLHPSANEIWPGRVNVGIVATVRNRGGHKIAGATLKLTFVDAAGDRSSDFVARQASSWSGTLAPEEKTDLPFLIEVNPQAVPDRQITVDGELRYNDTDVSYIGHANAPPHLRFAALNADLVVDTTNDNDDGSADTGGSAGLSLRKALRLANDRPGIDRIVFAPEVFVAGAQNVITLDASLPDLPALHGDVDPVLVIADNNRVTLTPDHAYDNSRRVALNVYGPAVIFGLEFLEMSRLVETGADCTVSPGPGVGSAIVVDGGENAAIMGNHFVDTGLAERPCTQTLVAVTGGRNHVLAGNFFENLPGNAISVFSPPSLVRGNRVIGGLNFGVVVDAPGEAVEVTGNLIVDLLYAGLFVREGSNVVATHNTFVRTHCDGVQALAPAKLWLRNNAYVGLDRPALAASVQGANIDAAFEATDGVVYCVDCAQTKVDAPGMIIGINLGFADVTGTTWEALTPTAQSLLVDSGVDVTDRNGSALGRFDGRASDRGAVERPQ